jgi:tRNA A37 methylthiotransferase MiaB
LEANTFYIETYGCASNKADSYIMSTLLLENNFTATNLEDAQFVIINTCAVKEQTENKIKARLKQLSPKFIREDKHIIIAGCLPYIASNYLNPKESKKAFYSQLLLDPPLHLICIRSQRYNTVKCHTASQHRSNFLYVRLHLSL